MIAEKTHKKKVLCFLMSLVMVITMLPLNGFNTTEVLADEAGVIHYDTNGGNAIDDYEGTLVAGTTVQLPNPLPVPTKTNAEFLGWYKDAAFTEKAVPVNSHGVAQYVNNDATLYAKWLEPYTYAEAPKYDIFLSIDPSLGYNGLKLLNAIKEKLIDKGIDVNNLSLTTASEGIDTLDLSDWYVYDHYDKAYWNNSDDAHTWEKVYGESTVKRPYQEPDYTDNLVDYYGGGGETCTLKSKGGADGSQFANYKNVAHLDGHIYSGKVNGEDAMVFSGYGDYHFTDFLFYNVNTSGTKTVNYTVDAAVIDTHTLKGAGLLVNSDIDDAGYIRGYILYYALSGATSISSISLYKINDNVKATTLSSPGYFDNYCTLVKTIATNLPNATQKWAQKMDIKLDITPTKLTVYHRVTGEEQTYTEIGSADIEKTSYRGIGPLVQYEEHGCSSNSLFIFTNLAISYVSVEGDATSTSLFSPASTAQFKAGSEKKVFVNLVNEDYTEVTPEDKAIMQMLQKQNVRLVTNYKSEDSDDFPTDYFGNGIGTVDVEGTVDQLATTLADKIYDLIEIPNNELKKATFSDADVSAASLYLKDPDNKEINGVLSGILGTDGAKVYLDTSNSVVASGDAVHYSILAPGADGEVELETAIDANGTYFVVKNDITKWPIGDYVVTAKYDTGLGSSKLLTVYRTILYRIDNGNTAPDPQYYSTPSIKLATSTGFIAPDNTEFNCWKDETLNKRFMSGAKYSGEENLVLVGKWSFAPPTITKWELTDKDNGTFEVTWTLAEGEGIEGYIVEFYQDNELKGTSPVLGRDVTQYSYNYALPEAGKLSKVYAKVTAYSAVAVDNWIDNFDVSKTLRYPAVAGYVPGGNVFSGSTVQVDANNNVVALKDTETGEPYGKYDPETKTITLIGNVQVKNPLNFNGGEVTFDLHNNYIVGEDGTDGNNGPTVGSGQTLGAHGANGTDGQSAISLTAGTVTVKNGSVYGGDGGNGGNGSTILGENCDEVYNGGNSGNGAFAITSTETGSIVLDNVSLNGGVAGMAGKGGVNYKTGNVGDDGTAGVDRGEWTGVVKNITVESGDYTFVETYCNYGFCACGNVTVNGGTLTVQSSKHYGLFTAAGMFVTGGTVKVSGSNYGYSTYVNGTFQLTGGRVENYALDFYAGEVVNPDTLKHENGNEINQYSKVTGYSIQDASKPIIITLGKTKMPTPEAKIDSVNKELYNLIPGAEYDIKYYEDVNGTPVLRTVPVTVASEGTIDISGYLDKDIQLIRKTDDDTRHIDSDPQPISLKLAPMPLGLYNEHKETAKNASDGDIAGLKTTKHYQYRKEGSTEWIDVPFPATRITGLIGGRYEVRTAADENSFESLPVVVTVETEAAPQGDPTTTLIGIVLDNDSSDPLPNMIVNIMKGNELFATGRSQADPDTGKFSFEVPDGVYNIVVMSEDGERTTTKIITVSAEEAVGGIINAGSIKLPSAKAQSLLTVDTTGQDENVKVEADFNHTVVGGLDAEAEHEKSIQEVACGHDLKEVKIEMKLTPEEEEQVEVPAKEAIQEETKDMSGIEYVDIVVEKTVTTEVGGIEDKKTTLMSQTQNIFKVVIPYDFTRKIEIKVLRYHDGVAQVFDDLEDNQPVDPSEYRDQTFFIDKANGVITIFVQKFSAYAIAYKLEPAPSDRKVTIAVPERKTISVGDKLDLDITDEQEDLIWTSSNEAIAIVDENGVVTGVHEGEAAITVTNKDGNTDTFIITVRYPDAEPADKATEDEIALLKDFEVIPKDGKIIVRWGKVEGATKYKIAISYCREFNNDRYYVYSAEDVYEFVIDEIHGEPLNNKKDYKVKVVAYKVEGKKKTVLAKTFKAHIVGLENKKYTYAKDIDLAKTKVTLELFKSYQIDATTILADSKKKHLSEHHAAEFRYKSSNPNVATVDKDGKVRAVARGTCYVYVYAQNGVSTRMKITVK